MRPDIQILLDNAEAFVLRLEALKTTRELAWYPYNSLAALEHLNRLLTGSNRRLMDLIGNSEVLDIGCGDGELAFYLESFGCKVKAIDHPPTNWNGMRALGVIEATFKASARETGNPAKSKKERWSLSR